MFINFYYLCRVNLSIYFDGACWNTRQPIMGFGCLALDRTTVIDEDFDSSPYLGTSNQAEYLALKMALRMCLRQVERGYTSFDVYGDSQVIVRQVTGIYKARKELETLRNECWEFITKHELTINLYWIPRAENQLADDLSKCGLNCFYNAELY